MRGHSGLITARQTTYVAAPLTHANTMEASITRPTSAASAYAAKLKVYPCHDCGSMELLSHPEQNSAGEPRPSRVGYGVDERPPPEASSHNPVELDDLQ